MTKTVRRWLAVTGLLLALVLAGSPAQAWEWHCSGILAPDPGFKPNPPKPGQQGLGAYFQTWYQSYKGRRVLVICMYYLRPLSEVRPGDPAD